MAVAAQEQMTPEAPEPARMPRRQRVVWPKPSQLRQSAPILRLLAEIWSIPQATKIGLSTDERDIHLWVVMPTEDIEAEERIYGAEIDFVQAAPDPNFDLDVLILDRMPTNGLPPFETVLER